jgi:protein-tyrosine phosphatase
MEDDITWVRLPGSAILVGMLPLPGLIILRNGGRLVDVERQAQVLDQLAGSGVTQLICLLCDDECEAGELAELAGAAASRTIVFSRWPIADFDAPDPAFDLPGLAALVDNALQHVSNVAFCCLAGYGRSGMMAARILIAYGMEPQAAVAAVRAVRPGAIESDVQLAYLLELSS